MKRLFPASLVLAAAVAAADSPVSYTGTFTDVAHPAIANARLVTLRTEGRLTVSRDARLVRLLVVGGGGGGGFGGGGGGGAIDWTPETPVFLKADESYTARIGRGGWRSANSGSLNCRGHNGEGSSFGTSGETPFVSVLGGSGGLAWDLGDGRWDVEEPPDWANGGGGAPGSASQTIADPVEAVGSLVGGAAGTAYGHKGGNATNRGSGSSGCGGAGGGGGAGGDGGDSAVLHVADHNDATVDAAGEYEHAGNGGPGLLSDITGTAVRYGGGGGGGVRGSDYKRAGSGGDGGGGHGAGLWNGSLVNAERGVDGLGGGGGGGGRRASSAAYESAAGGRGVVILVVAELGEGEKPQDRQGPAAEGGTVTLVRDPETKADFTVHSFRNGGTFVANRALTAELLLVGGGGAGGYSSGGGGGAGGLVHVEEVRLPRGEYEVVVGAGGASPSSGSTDGGASSLTALSGAFSLTALGGGAGGSWNANSGRPRAGGSSGGATRSTGAVAPLEAEDGSLQGCTGGASAANGSAGGGGAGGPGGDATAAAPGNGGAGLAFAISGQLRFYAAGGGGGGRDTYPDDTAGQGGSGVGGTGEYKISNMGAAFRRGAGHPGLDGTGSGGGGGAHSGGAGGAGGSGVVIVRYRCGPPGTVIFVR